MSPIIVSSTHNNRLGHCLQPTGRERAGAEKCRVWIVRHTHLQRKNVISSMQVFFHRDSSARRPLPRFPEPCTNKVHWEHLLEEMSWLSKDFVRERKWR